MSTDTIVVPNARLDAQREERLRFLLLECAIASPSAKTFDVDEMRCLVEDMRAVLGEIDYLRSRAPVTQLAEARESLNIAREVRDDATEASTRMTNKLPAIYIIINGRWPEGDVVSWAVAEDGEALTSHLSSSIGWARLDMGLVEGQGFWAYRKKVYHAKYPDGYRLVDLIDLENPLTDPDFKKAFELNQQRRGNGAAT